MNPDQVQQHYLTEQQLVERVRGSCRWVEKCLEGGDYESWSPHLEAIAFDPAKGDVGSHMFALQVPFNKAIEKQVAMENVAAHLWKGQVIPLAIVFTAEAWHSNDMRYSGHLQDDPNRREVITLCAGTIDMSARVKTQALITRKKGRIQPIKFDELETGDRIGLGLIQQVFRAFLRRCAGVA